MEYRFDDKTELRKHTRNQTVREVMVTGALSDTREVELRFTSGDTLTVKATPYGTLELISNPD